MYDPRGTDRGRIEKLISRSTKEHPARILAHLPYLQFRSCRNYSQRIGWAKLFMNDDVIRCFEMVHREQSETVKQFSSDARVLSMTAARQRQNLQFASVNQAL